MYGPLGAVAVAAKDIVAGENFHGCSAYVIADTVVRGLRKIGVSCELVSGVVLYDLDELKLLIGAESGGFVFQSQNAPLGQNQPHLKHSWCEVWGTVGIIIVDYLPPKRSQGRPEGLLIVEYKKDSSHRYEEVPPGKKILAGARLHRIGMSILSFFKILKPGTG